MNSPTTWGRGVRARLALPEVPPMIRSLLAERDGTQSCAACLRMGLTPPASEPLEVDHKQPISLGGDNHWTNLQVLCRYHNRSRGNRPVDPRRLPTWLAQLARERRLKAHVAWCEARGHAWSPVSKWLASQVEVLLANESSS